MGGEVLWTANLIDEAITVHSDEDDDGQRRTRIDGADLTRRRVWTTRCGRVLYGWRIRPDGQPIHGTSFDNGGVYILNKHANAIGAHWCRRCFREYDR